MAPFIKKKKRKELVKVREALDKDKSPLSEEEVHFIQTCCRIMKTSKSEKVKSVAMTAVSEGDGNPGLTIAAIKRLLEAIGSEAETCRRDSPVHYQTTRNADNMDALACSLQ